MTLRRAAARADPLRTDTLRLVDGRTLWLRPVDPADAAPIAGGFVLLGEEEVRRRYLHPVKELSPDYLQRLVRPPPGSGFAVVAAEPLPPGEALVGALARLDRDSDSDGDGAEFAVLVSRFIAGQGVGRALLQRLLEWARANAVGRVWGDVLEENAPMLQLAQEIGFERLPGASEPGLARVQIHLPRPRRRSR